MAQRWGDDATVNPTPTVRLGYRCEGIGGTSQGCSGFEETVSRGGWKVGGGVLCTKCPQGLQPLGKAQSADAGRCVMLRWTLFWRHCDAALTLGFFVFISLMQGRIKLSQWM